jgi:hypothetical protein
MSCPAIQRPGSLGAGAPDVTLTCVTSWLNGEWRKSPPTKQPPTTVTGAASHLLPPHFLRGPRVCLSCPSFTLPVCLPMVHALISFFTFSPSGNRVYRIGRRCRSVQWLFSLPRKQPPSAPALPSPWLCLRLSTLPNLSGFRRALVSGLVSPLSGAQGN